MRELLLLPDLVQCKTSNNRMCSEISWQNQFAQIDGAIIRQNGSAASRARFSVSMFALRFHSALLAIVIPHPNSMLMTPQPAATSHIKLLVLSANTREHRECICQCVGSAFIIYSRIIIIRSQPLRQLVELSSLNLRMNIKLGRCLDSGMLLNQAYN